MSHGMKSHGRHASVVLVFCPTKLAFVRTALGPICSFSHCVLAKKCMGLGTMLQYFRGTCPCCSTRSGIAPALLSAFHHEKEPRGREAPATARCWLTRQGNAGKNQRTLVWLVSVLSSHFLRPGEAFKAYRTRQSERFRGGGLLPPSAKLQMAYKTTL